MGNCTHVDIYGKICGAHFNEMKGQTYCDRHVQGRGSSNTSTVVASGATSIGAAPTHSSSSAVPAQDRPVGRFERPTSVSSASPSLGAAPPQVGRFQRFTSYRSPAPPLLARSSIIYDAPPTMPRFPKRGDDERKTEAGRESLSGHMKSRDQNTETKNYDEHHITPAMTTIMADEVNHSPDFQFVLLGSDSPKAPHIRGILDFIKKETDSNTLLNCYALHLVKEAEQALAGYAAQGTGSASASSASVAAHAPTSTKPTLKFRSYKWEDNHRWLTTALDHNPKAVFIVHKRSLRALIQADETGPLNEENFEKTYYAAGSKVKNIGDSTFNEVFCTLQKGYRKLLYSAFGATVVARLEREDSQVSAASAPPSRVNFRGEKTIGKGIAVNYLNER